MSKKQKKGSGSRKHGRNSRKTSNRGKALSRFVRGVITFEQYLKNCS